MRAVVLISRVQLEQAFVDTAQLFRSQISVIDVAEGFDLVVVCLRKRADGGEQLPVADLAVDDIGDGAVAEKEGTQRCDAQALPSPCPPKSRMTRRSASNRSLWPVPVYFAAMRRRRSVE